MPVVASCLACRGSSSADGCAEHSRRVLTDTEALVVALSRRSAGRKRLLEMLAEQAEQLRQARQLEERYDQLYDAAERYEAVVRLNDCDPNCPDCDHQLGFAYSEETHEPGCDFGRLRQALELGQPSALYRTLQADVGRLRALLRRIESSVDYCAVCDQLRSDGGHASDCELVAVLNEAATPPKEQRAAIPVALASCTCGLGGGPSSTHGVHCPYRIWT